MKGATVKDEDEGVVPRTVWWNPIDAQEGLNGESQPKLLAQFASDGVDGCLFASAMPPGRSQSGL